MPQVLRFDVDLPRAWSSGIAIVTSVLDLPQLSQLVMEPTVLAPRLEGRPRRERRGSRHGRASRRAAESERGAGVRRRRRDPLHLSTIPPEQDCRRLPVCPGLLRGLHAADPELTQDLVSLDTIKMSDSSYF